MKSFVSRRLRNAALTLVVLAIIGLWAHWQKLTLGNSAFGTGYILVAAVLFLACYNLRKKLPILSGATSGDWLQAHIYVGLGTSIVFGLHIDWRFPTGILELTLATLYLATFASGVVGLFWTRTIPAKLARVSEEVLYERIPMLRGQLCQRAQEAVLATARTTGTTTLGDFYSQHLHGFFEYPRGWRYFLRPDNRLRRKMLAELTEVKRYLSEPEQKTSEQLFAMVRRRDDLDYHEALQWRLKVWLFLHIGLTYPLVVVACLHGLLAHLFDGGGV